MRDYIHIADLADAHILALEALATGNRTYNLGNGHGFSVLEVIETARQITGHAIPHQIAARRPGDPAELVADSRRIKEELGWQPKTCFEGLVRIMVHADWKKVKKRGY